MLASNPARPGRPSTRPIILALGRQPELSEVNAIGGPNNRSDDATDSQGVLLLNPASQTKTRPPIGRNSPLSDERFEAALAGPGKPITNGIITAASPPKPCRCAVMRWRRKHSSTPLSLDEEPLPGGDRHGAEIADGTADLALLAVLPNGFLDGLRPQVENRISAIEATRHKMVELIIAALRPGHTVELEDAARSVCRTRSCCMPLSAGRTALGRSPTRA
jgi:hypothetical protein